MSTEEKKPNIFNQAINALSSRDEKAALEEAQKQLEELKKQLAEAQKAAAQAKASSQVTSTQAKSAAQKAIDEANKRAAEAEAKAREQEAKIRRLIDAQELADKRKDYFEAQKASEGAKVMAEHTLTAEETLSHLSLKYYGHATKPYWMVIYEANKDVIGDNPNRVRPGLKLKIPVLPAELKDK
jgi:nucleoid-associated protein YgaU